MSRWTKWVALQTDWARVTHWLTRWPKPRGGIHGTLAARWQQMGHDRTTGLWWVRRSKPL